MNGEPVSDLPIGISTYLTSQPPSGGLLKNTFAKPFYIKRFFSFGLLFITVLAPFSARASVLSDFVQFITGARADAEEGQHKELSAGAALALPLLGSSGATRIPETGTDTTNSVADNAVDLPTSQDSAFIGSRNPLGVLLPDLGQDQIFVYTIQKGDSATGIAVRFGISLNTLLWANNIKSAKQLKEGDELLILPVSGVQYEIKKGDTIEKIAKKFKGDASEIMSFNGLAVGHVLNIGDDIIIPDGELETLAPITPRVSPKRTVLPALSGSRFAKLPELEGYFLRPISAGRRSRGIHGYNGVDLADSCGKPIYASAAGTVIVARTSGWNGGYGEYVVISHPNGVQTLYGHMSFIGVAVGASVGQGERIGYIGSTGNSTGCHVHFEIRGAKNPF
ncbi:MAG: M23 family metallopeptidase [bacterium]|nr:M23 family metallopeptidase [bacterium]MDZ4299288.1 M23 family metallopeptidase [Candidatus Sungbacteria bacterium]